MTTERDAAPSGPLVCTEDPDATDTRLEDFQELLGRSAELTWFSPQHLRLWLDPTGGLDISALAQEKQCCGWFDFTLIPTTSGTVCLDIRVPAGAGRVRGPAPEQAGVGTAEEILQTFARYAEAGGSTRGDIPDDHQHPDAGAVDRCGAADQRCC